MLRAHLMTFFFKQV